MIAKRKGMRRGGGKRYFASLKLTLPIIKGAVITLATFLTCVDGICFPALRGRWGAGDKARSGLETEYFKTLDMFSAGNQSSKEERQTKDIIQSRKETFSQTWMSKLRN